MRKNKSKLCIMLTLCLTMVIMVVVARNVNTKVEASVFDYFKRIKLKDCIVNLEYDEIEWNGEENKPKVIVTYRNNELVENVDYIVEYKNNISAGKAKVKVRGIGEYRGTRNLSFTIMGIHIKKDCTYKLNGSSVYIYYRGDLVDPSNYTVTDETIRTKIYEKEYSKYVEVKYLVRTVYTVKGKGQYYGSFQYVTDEIEYEKNKIRK